MSYWGTFSEEIAKTFFNYDEVDYGGYWPAVVPEDRQEELSDTYADILSDAAGQLEGPIEDFLDAVKDSVELKLMELWTKVVGESPEESEGWYSYKDSISSVGDEMAHEEGFNAMGGVAEYNELANHLQNVFENMAYEMDVSDVEQAVPYSLQEDIEKQLMEVAQTAGHKDWERVEEDAQYHWGEITKDLQAVLDEEEDDDY